MKTSRTLRIGMSLAATATLAALPSAALAYVSPGDVFGDSDAPTSAETPVVDLSVPPTAREASSRVATQQSNTAVRRATAQAEEQKKNAPAPAVLVTETETKAEPAPSRLDPNVNYTIRQQRIAEQNATRPIVVIANNGRVTDAQGTVLHSGAPLITSTGPETALAVGALILAGIGTFASTALRRTVVQE